MLEVAKILVTTTATNTIFNKYGAIRSIHQVIVKYAAQHNIAMVKLMMRILAQRNEQAYKDGVMILREHFTEEELRDIFLHDQRRVLPSA